MIRLSLVLSILLMPTFVHSAAFQNGGFETGTFTQDWNCGDGDATTGTAALSGAGANDVTGWTGVVLAGAGGPDWSRGDCAGPEKSGTYAINLSPNTNNRNRIYQIFDTTAGATYDVKFWLFSWRTPDAKTVIAVNIKDTNASGTSISSTTHQSTPVGTYKQFTVSFTAASTTTYLAFETNHANPTDEGIMLDDVTVTQTSSPAPSFTLTNISYVYDVSNQNKKAVPQENMVYEWSLKNTASAPDVGSLEIDSLIPVNVAYQLGSLTFENSFVSGTTTGNPVTNKVAIASSNMTCCAVVGQALFSNDGVTFNYTPTNVYTDGGYQYDPNVRAIRIVPSGTMATGSVGTPVGFRYYYQGQIQ